MKKGIKKISKILFNVIIVIVIIISVTVTLVSLSASENEVPNLNGRVPFSIQSDSMKGTINAGDLIISEKYDNQELSEGDIISFFTLEEETRIVVTHRIIEIKEDNGVTSFITKGDNNILEDKEEVAPGDIVAVYKGTKITKVGYVLDFFKSKYGFLFGILLPLFIFFLYQLYSFITLVIEVKKEKMIKEINEAAKKA